MHALKSIAAVVLLAAAGAAQVQSQKLVASDPSQLQKLGSSVAIDGGWLVSGTPQDGQMGVASGAAYVFARRGRGWIETQKLFGSDTNAAHNFGSSVSMQNSMLIASSPFARPQGVPAAGAAYVFERFAERWVETAKLTASIPKVDATFGWAVAVDGNRILVGARGESISGLNSGAAYVFERNGNGWVETAKLVGTGLTSFSFFGQSVALHGDTALIGSSAAPNGSAYVFEFNGIGWEQKAKLNGDDMASNEGDSFSNALALSGDIALIAASAHAHGLTNSGAVYVFERLSGAWTQTQELRAHAPGASLRFGTSVSLSGDLALIGSTNEPAPLTAYGGAYLFRREPTGWIEIGRMQPNDPQHAGGFGARLALAGETAVVGSPLRDDLCPTIPSCDSGAVYVFDLAPDARQFGWCAAAAPCSNPDKHAGCANSTGFGATLAAAGSASLALDELRLEARRLQPGRAGLIFMGAGLGQSTLGDGLRFVFPGPSGLYRFGQRQSDPSGSFIVTDVISHGLNFAPPGQLQPGATWNFQAWYRDPSGPCNSGTNLTNALEITFGR